MRLLLIEDEDDLADALVAALGRRDFVVDRAGDLGDARAMLAGARYDAILLDRRLPDGEGLTLLADLARMAPRPCVLVLTALDETGDVIAGLQAGADDYLPKPFDVDELVARLHAVRRRRIETPTGSDGVALGRLCYDPGAREATVAGKAFHPPRREFLILEALLARPERVVTRQQLDTAVYGYDDEVGEDALTPHVSRLRKRLVEADAGVEIHTLRGLGYMIRERAAP